MKDIVLVVLKKYEEELNEKHKLASKEFFACKKKWKEVYRHSDDAWGNKWNIPEYHNERLALIERQKIAKLLLLVKGLIKELEK